MTFQIPFSNSYARLPERFYARIAPTASKTPTLVHVNRELAGQLGLDADWLTSPEGVDFVTGKSLAEGSEPIALAYAGHQFGNFVPQLGDGRAILLGEIIDSTGQRRDIHLKGSGRTPFSRGGDGRAALGPVLREYIVSEAMAALGIPTTRALAAATTGEKVARETFLPGAVIARVASSHIRVGTFQFFAAGGDAEGVRLLADYVIARHYPAAAGAKNPYRALLDGVIAAQADLVVKWLMVGFIHGVMNTDNMSIAGETIDYGPCAFLDAYDPATVFSSIDQYGRYAFGNQPKIALWNLTRLAECLLPLLNPVEDEAIADAQDALSAFSARFENAYAAGLREKIGLFSQREDDAALVAALLNAMTKNQVDFTLFFRGLADAQMAGEADAALRALFVEPPVYDEWIARWRARIQAEPQDIATRRAAMRRVNPAYIPRNHRVEAMIKAAVDDQDFGPFRELLAVVTKPFDDQPGREHYADPPADDERVLATFCGT